MTLDELLQKLKGLKRSYDLFGKTEYAPAIWSESFKDVELLIRQYALDNHDAELGILEAKVYAYEKIMANSNFAPMIVKEDSEVEQELILNKIKEEMQSYSNSFVLAKRNDLASVVSYCIKIVDKCKAESEVSE